MAKRHVVTIAVLLLVAAAGAAQVPEYERVLMPISSPEINGAHGSRWVTEHFIRNDGTAAVDVIREDCAIGPACLNEVPPGTTLRAAPSARGYLWVDVERAGAGQMYFLTTVRDVSRNTEPWGTSIPTIREDRFRRDKTQVLNVPSDDQFRLNLRAYLILDPGDESGVDLTVRIYDLESELPLNEGGAGRPTVLLGEKTYQLRADRFGGKPDYIMVACVECDFPAIVSANRLRIELERTAGARARLWALVTATNNETQHVTIFTPD